jgi:hypothetical protein
VPSWGSGPWGSSPWGDGSDPFNGGFETPGDCGFADAWTFSTLSSVEKIAGWDDGTGCLYSVESFEGGWSSNQNFIFAFDADDLLAGSWNYQNTGLPGGTASTPINSKTTVGTQEGFEVGWPAPISYSPLDYGTATITAGNESYAYDFNSVSSTPITFNYQVGVATPLANCTAVLVESFEQGWPSTGGNESYVFDFTTNPALITRALWNGATDNVESFEESWGADTHYSSFDAAPKEQAYFCALSIRGLWHDVLTGDVWAVGEKGLIAKYSGGAWTSYYVANVTGTLYGVWGNTSNDIWACGANGVIIHWDGVEWVLIDTSGATNTLYGVSGVGGEVWFVGSIGKVLYWKDGNLTSQTSQTSQALFAVHARTVSDVWAVGNGGVATRFNGTVWALSSTGVNTPLYGVWAGASNSVWAVGNLGTVRFYNGSTWSAQSLPGGATTNLYAVHGHSISDVKAVGAGGNIYQYTASWASFSPSSGITSDLRAVQAPVSTTLFWTAGDGGISRQFNGSAWVAATSTDVRRTVESFDFLWNELIG